MVVFVNGAANDLVFTILFLEVSCKFLVYQSNECMKITDNQQEPEKPLAGFSDMFESIIWVIFNDLTVLPNPGIMVYFRGIIPKWWNYSG